MFSLFLHALSLVYIVIGVVSAIGYFLVVAWLTLLAYQLFAQDASLLAWRSLARRLGLLGVTPRRYAWALVRGGMGCLVGLATLMGPALYLVTTADLPPDVRATWVVVYVTLTVAVGWLFADPLWISFQVLHHASQQFLHPASTAALGASSATAVVPEVRGAATSEADQ